MIDLFLDSESQSKLITCSKKQPPKNVLNDNITKRVSTSSENSDPWHLNTDDIEANLLAAENGLDDEDEAEKFDSPENLVYETQQISDKSSIMVNLTQLMATNIIIG